jgi:signal transduction histidine kinase
MRITKRATGPVTSSDPMPRVRPTRRRRRTVRLRLTAIYGGLFLFAGATLIAITALLWNHATGSSYVIQPKAPFTILRIAGAGVNVHSLPKPVAPDFSTHRPVVQPGLAKQLINPRLVNPQQVHAVTEALQVVARSQHDSDLRQLLLYSGIVFAGMALLTMVLSWLTAGRVLRPLRTISSRARDISASNLHERLGVDGPNDELRELGETFDELLARLESSFDAQRQFIANASHELRTPLATMRASLEVALAKPGMASEQMDVLSTRLTTELDQVDGLIESFLALARAERGNQSVQGVVRLDVLVADALEQQAGAIGARGLEVHDDVSGEAWVVGDTVLLRRLVVNLVDNAVRHNERGGSIEIQVGMNDGLVRLSVENGGEVLDPDAVAALGRPFRRIAADRTGSANGFGLGLSIVRAIAESHGGRIGLTARESGGLRVTVELPLSTPALSVAVP